jgi:hypothetical protein
MSGIEIKPYKLSLWRRLKHWFYHKLPGRCPLCFEPPRDA